MRPALFGPLAAVLILAAVAPRAVAAEPQITAEHVTYDQLGDIIRQNKGKVIVVDFWFVGCKNCYTKWPAVLALRDLGPKDDLLILSVLCYQEDNKEERQPDEAILAPLKQFKMTARNLILDENPDVWQTKLRIPDFPSMYVFTREGKWWHFKSPDKEWSRVTELVRDELKKAKP